MPLAYPADPSLIPIERPRCPKCQAPVMLARIEHGPAVSDLLTFECPKGEHVQKVLTKTPNRGVRRVSHFHNPGEARNERRLPRFRGTRRQGRAARPRSGGTRRRLVTS